MHILSIGNRQNNFYNHSKNHSWYEIFESFICLMTVEVPALETSSVNNHHYNELAWYAVRSFFFLPLSFIYFTKQYLPVLNFI